MRNRRSAGMWVVGSMLAVMPVAGCATTEAVDATGDARQAGARSVDGPSQKALTRKEVQPALASAFKASRLSSMPAVVDGCPRVIAAWIGSQVSKMQLQEPGFEVVH